jgi:PAS domain S-box-containing protein
MLLFGTILAVTVTSAMITNYQTQKVLEQETRAQDIAQGADELGYLSNEYLIYRESLQLKRWRKKVASFSEQVAGLRVDRPEQQALVANIEANQTRLKEVFDSVVSGDGNLSRNKPGALNLQSLHVSWSRMAVQIQGLASDASRLSQLLHQQRDELTYKRTMLMYVMAGLFGLFLLASYLLTYRRMLKSIATLQESTAVIGSGNLDFVLEERKNDEIGELSHAFNRMASDLKAVTASKSDLEREIVERARAVKALRSERDFTAAVLNTVGALVVVLNREGSIMRFNRACEALTGYTEAEVLGRVFWKFLVPGDELAGVHRTRELLHAGDFPNQHENHWVAKDGTRRLIAWTNTAIVDLQGEITSVIGAGVDITQRKLAEDQLLKQAAQLQERTALLEEANRELESFSYSVSHDLRTPLRAIDGFSRIILKQQGDKFDENTRRQFDLIRFNSKIMGNLIDDLLSFSRVQKTGMSVSVIDMSNLTAEVGEEIRAANRERKLEIRIADMLPGYGDPFLIRQVLVNLFSNAVKFTKDRKPAIVEISSFQEPDHVVYRFQDNGVGFDMAYYDKLFGVFQRLHSREEYEGTGVGLAIVQRIIVRHGGRVWAEGKVNEGATFYFSLPSCPP